MKFDAVLDVSAERSAAAPGTVWIPLEELENRKAELPAPYSTVAVLDIGVRSEQAIEVLRRLHRAPFLVGNPADGASFLWKPSQAAMLVNEHGSCGSVLDLGCGGGRDSVYLALSGWSVTGVDRVPDRLDEAEILRQRTGCSKEIDWVPANGQDWAPERQFDAVLLVYTFEPRLVRRCADWVAPGGLLAVQTFSRTHFECFATPGPTKCLSAEEIASLAPKMRVRKIREAWSTDRHSSIVILESSST